MPRGIYKRAVKDPHERFREKFVISKSGCWEWIGSVNAGGYGTFYMPLRPVLAHRFCYEDVNGTIEIGKELDHLCRNRRCVNPSHLEQVTRRENTLRGIGPTKLKERQKQIADQRIEFCLNGHSYKENPPYFLEGRKHCRVCKLESQRRRRAEK